MSYARRLSARIAAIRSPLCVGLDPRPDLVRGSLDDFLRRVVEETAPFAAAFKPNLAYFEALGAQGLAILGRLMEWLAADVRFILDGKRGDIPETMKYRAGLRRLGRRAPSPCTPTWASPTPWPRSSNARRRVPCSR
ncbi:MAG: orotidine 5'-phosphate decarboxylase / HUMPS family protein [Kiritimatiellia bacterium]